MSAVVKEISRQTKHKVIVFSSYPELFNNNPYVYKNIDIKSYSKYIQKIINLFLRIFKSGQIENFCFPTVNGGVENYMRESKAKISLIEAHTLHFKTQLDLKDAKPDIFFDEDELQILKEKFKDLPNSFAIIQPIGKTTYTPNKEWGFEKYQEVVNKTQEKIRWVQVGLENDVLLSGVVDMRGRTKTLRELAYVVSKSNFILSNEGLLNHIVASVNIKSFVVFSGFSQIELAKYDTTIPIVKVPQVECAPCWVLEKCPKDKKWCTEDILVEDVVKIIKKEMKF
ncbi:glycosyltransferase family 9 protein [Aliarcobacter cryaerophilus]|uniref:glycosyltransferase family 9 protein n=1 Tax=Aliarcobacter cryaerophilus TaxID=28198 RepID=UPI0021B52840|nr:glycosyltransferase family 9 protein [Aliarcobacter cryaerophilus]MCT7517023.1 hypothetical protein [Aliarcobacter cryaerophilus]